MLQVERTGIGSQQDVRSIIEYLAMAGKIDD
jgi:hypothetical protein